MVSLFRRSASYLSYFCFYWAIWTLASVAASSNCFILAAFSAIVVSLMSRNSRRVILSLLSSSSCVVVVFSSSSFSFSSRVTERFKSSANSCNWCSIEICFLMSPSYFCSCCSRATQFYCVVMDMSDMIESRLGSKFDPNSVKARSPARSASAPLTLFFPKHEN